MCLFWQALSKRIHYGKFVAEAKFRAQPEQYGALIRQRDAAGLMRLLTDEAVEAKVRTRGRWTMCGTLEREETCRKLYPWCVMCCPT